MTNEEIISNNRLIAEFMGLWYSEENYLYNPQFERAFKLEELQFHSSWDWLMPVVEKIEKSGFVQSIEITYDIHLVAHYCQITGLLKNTFDELYNESENKIEAVYQSVIEFIKWYNDKK